MARSLRVVDIANTDATHDSYYLGPGDHDNGTSTGTGRTTYRYFTRVSQQISDLIRRGEQEHLDDAQRAYDLSYGLAAREINALVGRRFGPAATPDAASVLARAELANRLPAALGSDPAAWVRALDAMLSMSSQRDRRGLHDIEPGTPLRRGNTAPSRQHLLHAAARHRPDRPRPGSLGPDRKLPRRRSGGRGFPGRRRGPTRPAERRVAAGRGRLIRGARRLSASTRREKRKHPWPATTR